MFSFLDSWFNYDAQQNANRTNLQIARETNEANRQLYREQFADQYKLWQETNEYNSAQAQVSRLRSAGLNPALAFGNSGANVGSASVESVPSASPMVGAHVEAPQVHYSDMANELLSLTGAAKSSFEAQSQAQINGYQSQIKSAELGNLLAQIDERLSSKDLTDQQRDNLTVVRQILSNDLKIQSDSAGAQVDRFNLENENLRANTVLTKNLATKAVEDTIYQRMQNKMAGIEIAYYEDRLRAAIAETYERIMTLRKSREVSDAEIEKIWAETATEHEVCREKKNTNEIIERTKEDVVQGAHEDVENKRQQREESKARTGRQRVGTVTDIIDTILGPVRGTAAAAAAAAK